MVTLLFQRVMEMSRFTNSTKYSALSFTQLGHRLTKVLGNAPELDSRCNRPLQMKFEDQLNALIFFHLEVLRKQSKGAS